MPTLIAHRGASAEAPENTLASIQRAIEIGVDFIEIDVRLSKDGIPVVIHDSTLKRITKGKQKTRISDMYLEEIQQIDAGSWFNSSFADFRVPTLDEVLKIKPDTIGLMIEIKKEYADPKHIAQRVLNSLNESPFPKNNSIVVGSFSPEIVKTIINENPRVPVLGIIEKMQYLPIFREMGVKHFAFYYKRISSKLVESFAEENLSLWAWTVDNIKTVRKLLSLGVHGIITNNPAAMLEVKEHVPLVGKEKKSFWRYFF